MEAVARGGIENESFEVGDGDDVVDDNALAVEFFEDSVDSLARLPET